MAFQDFSKHFQKVEICNLSPESLSEEVLTAQSKKKWEMNVEHGSWTRRVNAGGCRNYLGIRLLYTSLYSVLVSISCPKALYHQESDNLFRITVVVADWLGWNPYHRSRFCTVSDWMIWKIQTFILLELLVCIVWMMLS